MEFSAKWRQITLFYIEAVPEAAVFFEQLY
jgi:hypothetical protein